MYRVLLILLGIMFFQACSYSSNTSSDDQDDSSLNSDPSGDSARDGSGSDDAGGDGVGDNDVGDNSSNGDSSNDGRDNDQGDDSDNSADYHPVGFINPQVHGLELKLARQDCRICHGESLDGAIGPSCDTCHTPLNSPAWRQDCIFCHGGVEDDSGAPPRNIDGSDTSASFFNAHFPHLNSDKTNQIDCQQCHRTVTDVLSLGHMFDDTPAKVEVDFSTGLSPSGSYVDSLGCSNTYCHGGGRVDESFVSIAEQPMLCSSCHGDIDSNDETLGEMSGFHALHVSDENIGCHECHQQTTADNQSILDLNVHINGQRDVAFRESSISFDPQSATCSGVCHEEQHNNIVWIGEGGRFHPEGFDDPELHGPEMALQRQDCRGCHGDELAGSGSIPSCDSCHDSSWRQDCTFCHGGTNDLTGAPPRDLGVVLGSLNNSASFNAHSVHVQEGDVSPGYDCSQCHNPVTSLLDSNHAFDESPGEAEMIFDLGLSPQTEYSNGTCANSYCHSNGQQLNNTITDGTEVGCSGCHGSVNQRRGLSGEHGEHLGEGVSCGECHQSVVSLDGRDIIDKNLHLNGSVQIQFNQRGISLDANRLSCSGECHGEDHDNERWD